MKKVSVVAKGKNARVALLSCLGFRETHSGAWHKARDVLPIALAGPQGVVDVPCTVAPIFGGLDPLMPHWP